jgi:hypothetical protein
MSRIRSADDRTGLRTRANQLRQVLRAVTDPQAVQAIERFIAELEARANRVP